jgi:hypothetical protein
LCSTAAKFFEREVEWLQTYTERDSQTFENKKQMVDERGCSFALGVQHGMVKSRGNELVVFLSRQFAEDQTKRQEVMKEDAESPIRWDRK